MSIFENKNYCNRNINISLKNKYVYFSIQKAASSTIKQTLSNLELKDFPNIKNLTPHPQFYHSPFVKPYQLPEKQFAEIMNDSEFLKFTFVRNPYIRILSAYLNKIVGGQLKQQVLKSMNISKYKFYVDISFDQFIDVIINTKNEDKDLHWMPMSYILDYPNTKFDFIGKVENMEEDFKALQKLLKIDLTNYYQKYDLHKTDADNNIEKYYTHELKTKIAEHYAEDFELCGYQL